MNVSPKPAPSHEQAKPPSPSIALKTAARAWGMAALIQEDHPAMIVMDSSR